MDLIALWGLVGCAGLGCLISVPCRDWFNASWSWNCLIVQPSGDAPCLRRPAGLAKHCSRLSSAVCVRRKSVPQEPKFGMVGSTWRQTRGHTWEVDSPRGSPEYLTAGYLCRPHRNVYPYNISSQLDAIRKIIQFTINTAPIFRLWYRVSLW